MTALNWSGVALQVVGLLAAVVLLGRLRETVTGREVLAFRWFRSWRRRLRRFGRALTRRKPPTRIVAPEALPAFASAMAARVTTARGAMPDALSAGEQVTWLLEYVQDLERRHNELSGELGDAKAAQDRAVKEAREHAERLIREAVEQARADVLRLVGQDVGWEVFALGLVAVGVVLAAL